MCRLRKATGLATSRTIPCDSLFYYLLYKLSGISQTSTAMYKLAGIKYMCMNYFHLRSYSTFRIVGISTVSRAEHRVAQTREIGCTRKVMAHVVARGM